MHIIVDGYNLIRQSEELRRHERQSLEAGRRALLHRLALYRAGRDHRVTVVFDGREGDAPEEGRDLELGMLIIYSRRGQTADDVIERLAGHTEEETIVVTSDVRLAEHVRRRGGTVVSSGDFEQRLMAPLVPTAAAAEGEDEQPERDHRSGTRKKGASRRLPRRERAARRTLKKL